ncbi:MAG: DUF4476 domain-containing protein [Flavobacteriales bacterium]
MSVKVDDGTGSTKRTTTRTTTTTSTVVTSSTVAAPVVDTRPKRRSLLSIPCPVTLAAWAGVWPMSATEYAEAKKSIESKSFEDTKMTMAKQVGSGRCFTVDQGERLAQFFGFEDSKPDFKNMPY